MQQFINQPNEVVEDMLKGFIKTHQNLVEGTENPRVVKYKSAPEKGKVGIVTGGGSGHEPAFIGYIGKNMLDAVAVGEIFSSPTGKAFYDAICVADSGAGVAVLYGNYAGDNMNVKIAKELAESDGIKVKTVVANDDVPSAPRTEMEKRRGVAGEILLWKIGGAKAASGASLDEVIAVAKKAISYTRSIGVGLAPCAIPEVGKPNFQIEPGTMEVGIGHHGEPGVSVEKLRTADEVADIMVKTILDDFTLEEKDEVVVLVSGLGATPIMELYILYNKVEALLEAKGIKIHRTYVGNYFTSLEMKGATLTVMKLDEELKTLMNEEVNTVGMKQFKE